MKHSHGLHESKLEVSAKLQIPDVGSIFVCA